jgi:hypothetical protein
MEYKEVSILICDDCMDAMDTEDYNIHSKRKYIRKCIYYGSTVASILFLLSLFIWSYIVVMEVESMPDHE